jgi:hypothetical protein
MIGFGSETVRAGVKASLGDDSSPYEVFGGTRVSERKTASRILEWSAGIRLHLRLSGLSQTVQVFV